jgi:hypothetical protein
MLDRDGRGEHQRGGPAEGGQDEILHVESDAHGVADNATQEVCHEFRLEFAATPMLCLPFTDERREDRSSTPDRV